MKVPILTYHSMDVAGNDYVNNDLVAFSHDLGHVTSAGFRILPLAEVVRAWREDPQLLDGIPTVAFTCDDGSDFDFHDLPHPNVGVQRSVINTLKDFASHDPRMQPGLSITSFVVVSPDARRILDRTCLLGRGWWTDGWWKDAIASGLMAIANHSWDHNHDTLDEGDFPGVERGNFDSIATRERADFQIRQASDYLWKIAPNPGAALFAYPYGKANAFLAQEYFPRYAAELRIQAAFADHPEPLHEHSNVWEMPRYVFRRDWRSPTELRRILDEARP